MTNMRKIEIIYEVKEGEDWDKLENNLGDVIHDFLAHPNSEEDCSRFHSFSSTVYDEDRDDAWGEFMALLERPPQIKPRLRELLNKPSVFEGGVNG